MASEPQTAGGEMELNCLPAESRLGKIHVDEVMRRVQDAFTKGAIARFRALSMRMGMEGARKLRARDQAGTSKLGGQKVTNLVEFYIPTTFRKRLKVTFRQGRGKLIEFRPSTKKSV